MHSAGLTAVAINADTLTSARKTKRSLYEDIEHGVSMVLLSPEQLKSSAFEKLVNKPSFKERLCMMAVDKAHLLNTWGQSFRKDFQQIGWVRARFQHSIPIAAVTATLQVGGPTDRVRKFLGFEDWSSSCHTKVKLSPRHQINLSHHEEWPRPATFHGKAHFVILQGCSAR